MASFEISTDGKGDVFALAQDLSDATDEKMDEMLIAQAKVYAPKIKFNATAMLNEKGYSKRITADSVTIGKPTKINVEKGSGKQIKIYFRGNRDNGKKKKRNAEVAFVNEYGTRRTTGRQFIKRALDSEAESADIEVTKEFDALLREIFDE